MCGAGVRRLARGPATVVDRVDVTQRRSRLNNAADQACKESGGRQRRPGRCHRLWANANRCLQCLFSPPAVGLLASITVSFCVGALPPSLWSVSVIWPPLLSIYFLALTSPLLFRFSLFPPFFLISIIPLPPLHQLLTKGMRTVRIKDTCKRK